MPKIFDISIWWTSLWLFGHHTFSYKSLSLFPSRILVCAMAFAARYLFSFWDLHWLSSLSKKKKSGKIYRHKSMQVSRTTKPLTNHSWQVWKSIYNNHIDVKIFPTMIWVHKEQAMFTNAQSHLYEGIRQNMRVIKHNNADQTFYVFLDLWHKSK